MTARDMAMRVATAIDAKKGSEVRVLDLRGVCGFADFFVLATGSSDRHVRTLADAAIESAAGGGAKPLGVEGKPAFADQGDLTIPLAQREPLRRGGRRVADREHLLGRGARGQQHPGA